MYNQCQKIETIVRTTVSHKLQASFFGLSLLVDCCMVGLRPTTTQVTNVLTNDCSPVSPSFGGRGGLHPPRPPTMYGPSALVCTPVAPTPLPRSSGGVLGCCSTPIYPLPPYPRSSDRSVGGKWGAVSTGPFGPCTPAFGRLAFGQGVFLGEPYL